MKGYFSMPNPPAKVVKLAIGDGAMSEEDAFQNAPVVRTHAFSMLFTLTSRSQVSVIETFPQLIGYNPDVYNYFAEQAHLCGFDLNLTYPQQGGHFSSLVHLSAPSDRDSRSSRSLVTLKTQLRNAALHPALIGAEETKRGLGRSTLKGRANGTLDSWYQCDLFDELWDYAVNYTFPFSEPATFTCLRTHR
jgi:carboxypeptidase D